MNNNFYLIGIFISLYDNMKKEQYLKFMDYIIKISNNKEYNTQAVAKMLGLPSNKKYNI